MQVIKESAQMASNDIIRDMSHFSWMIIEVRMLKSLGSRDS